MIVCYSRQRRLAGRFRERIDSIYLHNVFEIGCVDVGVYVQHLLRIMADQLGN